MYPPGAGTGMAKTRLRCRECGTEAEPGFRYVCDECFGP